MIQEYFQKRVEVWLNTVGKEVFKIKYHWLRYEFAPGRGQIHAHMLLIMENQDIQKKVYNAKTEEEKASLIDLWMKRTFGMTTHIPNDLMFIEKPSKQNHPAKKYLQEVDDLAVDAAHLCLSCQFHVCTNYCLKKRKYL